MKKMHENAADIWLLAEHRKKTFTPDTFGLISEARRMASKLGKGAMVTAVVMGRELPPEPETLGHHGVDRVLAIESETLSHYHGERQAEILFPLLEQYRPKALLAVQNPDTADLCARLGGMLETGVVTHAVDLTISGRGEWIATRPIANGYLFEEIRLETQKTSIIAFHPAVLMPIAQVETKPAEVESIPVKDISRTLKTEVLEVILADPKTLDIEEADIIVSAGRGIGREGGLELIEELAGLLKGSVAATRPVIDWHLLPYERQIGQTGKTVTPRLIINCGISGANEYTASCGAEFVGRTFQSAIP